MDNTDYFARIPYTLFSAYEKGEIGGCEFLTMTWLYKWADWSTGVIRKVTAARLTWATNGEWIERTFQRAIHSLHEKGYIVSSGKAGSHKPYPVVINNYLALSGASKDAMINITEIKTSTHSTEADVAERCEAQGEVKGEVKGEVMSHTTRLTRDSVRDSGQDSDQDFEALNEGMKGTTNKTREPSPFVVEDI